MLCRQHEHPPNAIHILANAAAVTVCGLLARDDEACHFTCDTLPVLQVHYQGPSHIELAQLGPLQFFGEMSLLIGEPRGMHTK